MQVQERALHIDVTIRGTGLEKIKKALAEALPEALVIDDDELIKWESTALAKKIRMNKTPGKLLRAYRERAGLSVVALAEKTGIKYTNISAMEHDARNIGLITAKRLGAVLGVDYIRLLEK
ncbi:MAG: helix-turn-helix domain-containing protein [Treponema sp.]|jgi:DNA-binding XRE family transcriptional regulator|nr:helix-turn-helix domain-containing protein [Treponema sp.]